MASTRVVYPFAKGIFHDMPDMGIDYQKLVVGIDGNCGVQCIFPTLEDMLLNQQNRIAEIQEEIERVASLFAYGMGNNTFQYVDTLAAALVQIRHHILTMFPSALPPQNMTTEM
mmetsp:Transcript_26556/g.46829  ORF Transcript_26556/g.46829 Transcript_26556/m.46829 type:complete len:114 (-) Transcript_26556:191-532(-)